MPSAVAVYGVRELRRRSLTKPMSPVNVCRSRDLDCSIFSISFMEFRRNRARIGALFIIVAAVGLGADVGFYIASFVSSMKHAELASVATQCVSEAATSYVRERRRWPKSWDDLTSVCPIPNDDGLFDGQWNDLKLYVSVDFTVRLSDLTCQHASDFDAIKPVPPILRDFRQNFSPLLQAIRDVLRAEGGSNASNHETVPESRMPGRSTGQQAGSRQANLEREEEM